VVTYCDPSIWEDLTAAFAREQLKVSLIEFAVGCLDSHMMQNSVLKFVDEHVSWTSIQSLRCFGFKAKMFDLAVVAKQAKRLTDIWLFDCAVPLATIKRIIELCPIEKIAARTVFRDDEREEAGAFLKSLQLKELCLN
jgi:hypothetical protein